MLMQTLSDSCYEVTRDLDGGPPPNVRRFVIMARTSTEALANEYLPKLKSEWRGKRLMSLDARAASYQAWDVFATYVDLITVEWMETLGKLGSWPNGVINVEIPLPNGSCIHWKADGGEIVLRQSAEPFSRWVKLDGRAFDTKDEILNLIDALGGQVVPA